MTTQIKQFKYKIINSYKNQQLVDELNELNPEQTDDDLITALTEIISSTDDESDDEIICSTDLDDALTKSLQPIMKYIHENYAGDPENLRLNWADEIDEIDEIEIKPRNEKLIKSIKSGRFCQCRVYGQKHNLADDYELNDGHAVECGRPAHFNAGDNNTDLHPTAGAIGLCRDHFRRWSESSKPCGVRHGKRYGNHFGTIHDTQNSIMNDPRFGNWAFVKNKIWYNDLLKLGDRPPFIDEHGCARLRWMNIAEQVFMKKWGIKETRK